MYSSFQCITESSCTYLIPDFPGRFGPNDNNFDGLYDSNLSCTWSLYLPPNNNGLVQVYLTELDIQEDSECLFDYVEVGIRSAFDISKSNFVTNY